MRHFQKLSVVLLFVAGPYSIAKEPVAWMATDMHRIDIEWHPKNDAKPAKYILMAVVVKEVKLDNKNCWLLAIAPNDNLPDDSDLALHLTIDKKTGWPLKAVQLDGEWQGKLIGFPDRYAITNLPELFPAEFFGIPELGEHLGGLHKLVVAKEKTGQQTKVDVRAFSTTRPSCGASAKPGGTATSSGTRTKNRCRAASSSRRRASRTCWPSGPIGSQIPNWPSRNCSPTRSACGKTSGCTPS